MKPKEFIKKHNIDSGNFSHDHLLQDIIFEFMTLLEVGKARENIKGYDNAVRAIRLKWDAINKHTNNQLPEKLWKYFYATVVAKMREDFFPEEMEKRRKEAETQRRWKAETQRGWKAEQTNYWSSFYYDFLKDILNKIVEDPTEHFTTLGINDNATVDEVKSAFRKKALKYHPDHGGNQKEFEKCVNARNRILAFLS